MKKKSADTTSNMEEERHDHEPSVFTLRCAVQKYLWGKVGKESEVAKLSMNSDPSFELDASTTYAELWMGTHPNGPSRIVSASGNNMLLAEWVRKNTHKLGTKIQQKFNGELSFLFKVLSVNTALSIQAHPDKALAEKIHTKSPDVYKDPNHKPEMTIALTPFRGLCGFRPITEIADFLTHIKEFQTVVGIENSSKLCNASKSEDNDLQREAIRDAFTNLMKQDKDIVQHELSSLVNRVEEKSKMGQETSQYVGDVLLKVTNEFPGDVGCFAIYFLNVVDLRPGEAMYLKAALPHAYLSGDCMECMACSDNVIRAGLTPKFRDVNLLCEMLDYNSYSPEAAKFQGIKQGETTYFKPDIDDFMVTKYEIPVNTTSGTLSAIDSASICIVIQGEGQATSTSLPTPLNLGRGSVIFISANEELHLSVSDKGMLMFRASCNVG